MFLDTWASLIPLCRETFNLFMLIISTGHLSLGYHTTALFACSNWVRKTMVLLQHVFLLKVISLAMESEYPYRLLPLFFVWSKQYRKKTSRVNLGTGRMVFRSTALSKTLPSPLWINKSQQFHSSRCEHWKFYCRIGNSTTGFSPSVRFSAFSVGTGFGGRSQFDPV